MKTALLTVLGLLTALPAAADTVTTWHGTSTCQVHPSPCHDETIVYYGEETGPDSYRMRAFKVVNGKEVDMGELKGFHADNTLTLYSTDRQGRKSTWHFLITGHHLSGTLTTPDGVTFRRIEADQAN